ncbi:MAG: S8 family serine peptidase [Actinomycetota bacterium]
MLRAVGAVLAAVLLLGATAAPAGADDDDDDDRHSSWSQGSSIDWSGLLSGFSSSSSATIEGSLYDVVDQINARELWEQGITGQGVDVAVIDTGVMPVAQLADPDKVRAVVDLSLEAEVPEAVFLDTYGHGTHMAGIIAGSDPTGDPATAAERPEEFHGVAPGAGIVSVKVADNTGAVDVSQVIAAIDWVIQHRDAEGLNIRVINLSYGTDSEQPYAESPLAYAVERAWDAGLVVVVAAGNDGWMDPGLAAPANDPYVIAVGAAQVTDRGTSVPHWASGGRVFTQTRSGYWAGFWSEDYSGRIPDVVAPGASIESLVAPGSRSALDHPEAFVTEQTMKGSGTSQAAAVVSGAAALLLQDRPELTPDQVKALLTSSADRLDWTLSTVQGHGMIDVAAAVATPTPNVVQSWPRSSGLGSLEAARGSAHVVVDGAEVRGEVTVDGSAWNPEAWIADSRAGTTWTNGEWNGFSWTGNSWTGFSWTGNSWTGFSWTGNSWTGFSWTGNSWTGFSWTGNSWTGFSWTGHGWR